MTTDADPRRSRRWHGVWNRRDEQRVRFDGWEGECPDLRSREELARRLAAFVATTLRLGPDDDVADLGCGTGAVTRLVAPGVSSVLALDYSEHALEVAKRTPGPANVTYRHQDLMTLDPGSLGVKKAYATSVFHYLDDYASAHSLLTGLLEHGVEVVINDVPDARVRDAVERHYDVEEWSHLRYDPDQLLRDFPGITFFRGVLSGTANDPHRFSFHLRPAAARG